MKLRTIGYAAVVAMTAAAFVIGSAVPSDARAKKKKAEAAPPPPVCFIATGSAVCATKGGMKFTYANSCYAAKDGAVAAPTAGLHFTDALLTQFEAIGVERTLCSAMWLVCRT